jgi:hypothetical protein
VQGYDPKTRTNAQLAKDLEPTPRPSETPQQAQARVQAAAKESQYRQVNALLSKTAPKINIAENDADFGSNGAHTVDRHGWNMSFSDLKDRVLGIGRWTQPQSFSYKWISESIANRVIRQHITDNWTKIRESIAKDLKYDATWDSGSKSGVGFYDKNYQSHLSGVSPVRLAPDPVLGETSWVTLRIRFDPVTKKIYVLTAFLAGKFW